GECPLFYSFHWFHLTIFLVAITLIVARILADIRISQHDIKVEWETGMVFIAHSIDGLHGFNCPSGSDQVKPPLAFPHQFHLPFIQYVLNQWLPRREPLDRRGQ